MTSNIRLAQNPRRIILYALQSPPKQVLVTLEASLYHSAECDEHRFVVPPKVDCAGPVDHELQNFQPSERAGTRRLN